MAVIEIQDQLAKALRAHADIRDMTLEDFLLRIVETVAPINSTSEFSEDEFDRILAEASSEPPVLPHDFSRANLYDDHD
jgi:hypothetical protein